MHSASSKHPALMVMSAGTCLEMSASAQLVGSTLLSPEGTIPLYEVDLKIDINLLANVLQLVCTENEVSKLKTKKNFLFRLSNHPEGIVFEAVNLNDSTGWHELYT